MSKVIKNNDGVAIVEGTPAASLIKDADKFFAAKVDTRMAGEAPVSRTIKRTAQSGRIDTRNQSKVSDEIKAAAALTKPMMQMIDGRNTMVGYMVDGESTMFSEAEMNLSPLERADLLPQRVRTAMQGGDPRGKEEFSASQTIVRGKSLDPKEINTKTPTPKDLEQMNNPPGKEPMAAEDAINRGLASISIPRAISTVKPKTVKPKTESTPDPDAILAMNLARDFKRQRSAKEDQRSQEEKDATKGKFISTLGR